MSNRLANEPSPYLLQHANNPVDWYPWGQEAIGKAKHEDKPIFLSIGYSACHWCHVMAHESFEDAEIAGFLNDHFVSIKVDREERPDVDHIYMQAVQAITGGGGWPLSVFLTPEGAPFFGGTYFPPTDSHGMPGFLRVLKTIHRLYVDHKEEVIRQSEEIRAALSADAEHSPSKMPGMGTLDEACSRIIADFDNIHGGFGTAPKFPEPAVLEFLLRSYHRVHDKEVLERVKLTLQRMAWGGIYDQLGGGFHRYSVDDIWRVPHFEKMLYDNALLSGVYTHAYQATKGEWCKRVATETADFVLGEMQSAEGGFYSSLDADSDGGEGKYYLWSRGQIEAVFGKETSDIVCGYYGIIDGDSLGGNVLHIEESADRFLQKDRTIRERLLRVRQTRARPARDEKIIASWNGLMLGSLSEAGCTFGRKDYIEAAVRCADFTLGFMVTDGRLAHAYKDNKMLSPGYLEDYGSVIRGLLDLNAASFSVSRIDEAVWLADTMISEFHDESQGKLYDTAWEGEQLFVRPRNSVDGAVPCGGSVAAEALLRLYSLTGNQHYERIAKSVIMAAGGQISEFPRASANWLCALDFYLRNPLEIVIVGKREAKETEDVVSLVYGDYLPNKVVAAREPGDSYGIGTSILDGREMVSGRTTVYLCKNRTCGVPLIDWAELKSELEAAGASD